MTLREWRPPVVKSCNCTPILFGDTFCNEYPCFSEQILQLSRMTTNCVNVRYVKMLRLQGFRIGELFLDFYFKFSFDSYKTIYIQTDTKKKSTQHYITLEISLHLKLIYSTEGIRLVHTPQPWLGSSYIFPKRHTYFPRDK